MKLSSPLSVNEYKSKLGSPDPRLADDLILNQSQGEQKFSSEAATPVKAAESFQLGLAAASEQRSLEGQSVGRAADSDISYPPMTEQQILDTANNIIKELAEKLLENQWSVKDVFDHQKLIHYIESYDGEQNVKAISPKNFLGRLDQVGFKEIKHIQVACLMRILGKSDQDNAILFKELSKLLESYNVPFETKEPEPVDDQPPLMRKQTRRDTIISRVIMSKNLESAYNKITVHIANYKSNIESLMDIFRARSHKQSIKSSSRQSETQVI